MSSFAGTGVAILDAGGFFVDADEAALAILGRGHDEVVGHHATEFMVQPPTAHEREALDAEWQLAGSPDVEGAASLRRADGSVVRVRFLITPRAEGGSTAIIEPLEQTVVTATTIRTVGDVLTNWRAAERRLEVLDPGSDEADAINAEVEALRVLYHELVDERRGRGAG
jgi:PAS domain S-box-containing protein